MKCSNMNFPESHKMFQYEISRVTWNVLVWNFQNHMKCCSMTFPESHEMLQHDNSMVTWHVPIWHFQRVTCRKCFSSKTKYSSMIYIPVVPSLDKCFYRFMNSANEFCKTLRHHWCMITEITNRSPLFMHLRPRIHLFR